MLQNSGEILKLLQAKCGHQCEGNTEAGKSLETLDKWLGLWKGRLFLGRNGSSMSTAQTKGAQQALLPFFWEWVGASILCVSSCAVGQ